MTKPQLPPLTHMGPCIKFEIPHSLEFRWQPLGVILYWLTIEATGTLTKRLLKFLYPLPCHLWVVVTISNLKLSSLLQHEYCGTMWCKIRKKEYSVEGLGALKITRSCGWGVNPVRLRQVKHECVVGSKEMVVYLLRCLADRALHIDRPQHADYHSCLSFTTARHKPTSTHDCDDLYRGLH